MFIHHLIGFSYKAEDIIACFRHSDNIAETCTEDEGVFHALIYLGDIFFNSVCKVGSRFFSWLSGKDDELITAEAAEDLVIFAGLTQHISDTFYGIITDIVTIGIINNLKTVQVDEHEHYGEMFLDAFVIDKISSLNEAVSVIDTGEGILSIELAEAFHGIVETNELAEVFQ